jgi:hypothetical protein
MGVAKRILDQYQVPEVTDQGTPIEEHIDFSKSAPHTNRRRASQRRRKDGASSWFMMNNRPEVFSVRWRDNEIIEIAARPLDESIRVRPCKGCGGRIKHSADVCAIEQAMYQR